MKKLSKVIIRMLASAILLSLMIFGTLTMTGHLNPGEILSPEHLNGLVIITIAWLALLIAVIIFDDLTEQRMKLENRINYLENHYNKEAAKHELAEETKKEAGKGTD